MRGAKLAQPALEAAAADSLAHLAGGKRNEVLTFVGEPGTLLENDIVSCNGHEYDVRNVGRTTANSVVAAETYLAVREVDI